MRKLTLVFLGCAAGFGVLNYALKQTVTSLEDELARLTREAYKTQESLHLLQAEWSYLNEPSRLQALVSKHLPGIPLSTAQLITYDQLPSKGQGEEVLAPATTPGSLTDLIKGLEGGA